MMVRGDSRNLHCSHYFAVLSLQFLHDSPAFKLRMINYSIMNFIQHLLLKKENFLRNYVNYLPFVLVINNKLSFTATCVLETVTGRY